MPDVTDSFNKNLIVELSMLLGNKEMPGLVGSSLLAEEFLSHLIVELLPILFPFLSEFSILGSVGIPSGVVPKVEFSVVITSS